MDLDSFFGQPGFIAPISGTVGALAAVLIARIKKGPDVQKATSEAVAGIIHHYTAALTYQTKQVVELRADIAALRGTVERQNDEIAELNQHIVDLSNALERHGITPPARRKRSSSDKAAARKAEAAAEAAGRSC